jgi:micrococcal nuclease
VFSARCDSELQLGLKAKARLEQLIASGTARIIESGRLDKYGRTLATLTVNGEDVAAAMIGEGLARPYHGERRQGWCENACAGKPRRNYSVRLPVKVPTR